MNIQHTFWPLLDVIKVFRRTATMAERKISMKASLALKNSQKLDGRFWGHTMLAVSEKRSVQSELMIGLQIMLT
jgi:hypothetical protein